MGDEAKLTPAQMVVALKVLGQDIVQAADAYLSGEKKSPHLFYYRVCYGLDDIAEYLDLKEADCCEEGFMDLAIAKFAEAIGPEPDEEAATPSGRASGQQP